MDTDHGDQREKRIREALKEGVSLFNSGHYFECHEVLEEVWLEEKGRDKLFLQGIIKAAAAFHHYKKGTYRGMLNLLRAAIQILSSFKPAHRGIELQGFVRALNEWLPQARELLDGVNPGQEVVLPRLSYER